MKKIFAGLLLSLTFAIGSVEGTYLLVKDNHQAKKIMGKFIVFTFGKSNYSLSSGPHGIYEISNNQVILNGGFSNVFDITKSGLRNHRWILLSISKEESKKYLTPNSESMFTPVDTKSNNAPTKLPF
jgi:hypothetical protein